MSNLERYKTNVTNFYDLMFNQSDPRVATNTLVRPRFNS